ncbi:VolA/Pla-1 family phospholipase [Veronia pacifica]|uniref:Bacterial virulence factor lipase N-terminal domain-containing protein n=2 Tax=Veronia pacifica TaxID=1080227 RepID=A0A1C3EJZ1_9GAMM|nr:hypothetical protein A8L45_09780 [Veronia pacifica]
MNKKLIALMVAASIGLAACGGESEVTGAKQETYITESLKAETKVAFDLLSDKKAVPIPSFILMDKTDGTLGLPVGENDSKGIDNPVVAMNSTDGWGTTTPIQVEFNGKKLDRNSLGARSFRLIEVSSSDSITNATFVRELEPNKDYLLAIVNGNTVIAQPLKPLNPSSNYMFAITNELKDENGKAVGMTQSYATLKSSLPTPIAQLKDAQPIVHKSEKLLASNSAEFKAKDIIYSSWFSTESVGSVVGATKAAIAKGLSVGDFTSVWKGNAIAKDVDVTNLYHVTVDSDAVDFETALRDDTNFLKFIAQNKQETVENLLLAYSIAKAAGEIEVVKGTVDLPYFLDKSPKGWNSTPFTSAMPSVAKIAHILKGDDPLEKAFLGRQLKKANIDPSKLIDPEEAAKLVGVDLLKMDGTRLDSDREVGRYSPIPQIKSVENVPFLVFMPKDPLANEPLKLVIYQHGITSSKENAYAAATGIINSARQHNKNIALMVIDQPLHGVRSLDDRRSANVDVTAYLNLTHLPVARDNIRQSVLDNLGLRAAIATAQSKKQLNGTPLQALDNTLTHAPALFGHSLGGITGMSTVSAANQKFNAKADGLFAFSRIATANSGGNIASLLMGSQNYGPLIKGLLAQRQDAYRAFMAQNPSECSKATDVANCFNAFEVAATPNSKWAPLKAELDKSFSQFTFATQTVLDTIDPYSMSSLKDTEDKTSDVLAKLPIYMLQAENDNTVPNAVASNPNAGSIPMAKKLGLTNITQSNFDKVSGNKHFVKFNETALHSTVIAPSHYKAPEALPVDMAHTMEMQQELGQFLSGIDEFKVVSQATLEQ